MLGRYHVFRNGIFDGGTMAVCRDSADGKCSLVRASQIVKFAASPELLCQEGQQLAECSRSAMGAS